MQVGSRQKSLLPYIKWAVFFRKTALSLGVLLLASGIICWVAANWAAATAFQKLAGVQAALAVIILAAWLFRRRLPAHTDRNFSPPALLMGLAGVAIGALLALVGQIYQTGADSWQLFAWWALLLLPWLLITRTVFLGLLWVLLINTGVILYTGWDSGLIWLPATGSAGMYLTLAVINGVLLVCWERCCRLLDDRWRVGPRVLGMTVLGALVAAILASFDDSAGYGLHTVVALSLGALALMYYIYGYKWFDAAMMCLAAFGAFAVISLYLVSFVSSEVSLLGLIVALMLLSGVLLHYLRARLRTRAALASAESSTEGFSPATHFAAGEPSSAASPSQRIIPSANPLLESSAISEPWFMAAFRTFAMWVTGGLIVAWLLIFLELDLNRYWLAGLLLIGVGLLALRISKGATLREAGATVTAAGLFLVCLDWYGSGLLAHNLPLIATIIMGVIVYSLGPNFALRFFTAGLVIWVGLSQTWTSFPWYRVFDLDSPSTGAWAYWPVYGRLGVLFLAAIGAFYAVNRSRLRDFWLPAAWALTLSAQAVAWLTPVAGIVLALAWLILGFAQSRRILMAFGVLSLLACLARFYYSLDITLLHKAWLLAASGAVLIALRGLAFRYIQPAAPHQPSHLSPWREAGVLAGLLLILFIVNIGIYQREQILRSGQSVVLALAPVDPRSLIQGDYMALDYAVARAVRSTLEAPEAAAIRRKGAGYLVLQPDAKGVFQLQALRLDLNGIDEGVHAATPGASDAAQETLLEFRLRPSGLRIVTNAYFFPEGQAKRFEHAKYGQFKVSSDGIGLLTGLLDENMRPL